jgi:hypothetical protein
LGIASASGFGRKIRTLFPAWLLTAAIRNRMKLLTFDSGIEQLLASTQERSKHVTVLHA